MNNKFISYGFDSYIQTFQQTYHENPIAYQEELANFLREVDAESKEVISRFHTVILSLPLPTKDFLIRKTKIYSSLELQQLALENRFLTDIHKYYRLYNLVGDEKLAINVFKYHCGLKFLPAKVQKSLYQTIIIDGGAFFGDSALIFNRYKPANIVCFEPNSVNFQRLRQTISNNNIPATLVQAGLADNTGERPLYYVSQSQNHGASYQFQANNSKAEITTLTTIDSYLQQHKNNFPTQRVGLIKLDVEGYGLESIQGAKNTILQHKPIISCAIYHNPKEMFGVYQALKSLHKSYKIQVFALSQGIVLKDLTLLAY